MSNEKREAFLMRSEYDRQHLRGNYYRDRADEAEAEVVKERDRAANYKISRDRLSDRHDKQCKEVERLVARIKEGEEALLEGRVASNLQCVAESKLRRELKEKDRQIRGYQHECRDVEQTLGKALGYPEIYPHVTDIDDGQICVGEHVASSIALEAARKLLQLHNALGTFGRHQGDNSCRFGAECGCGLNDSLKLLGIQESGCKVGE